MDVAFEVDTATKDVVVGIVGWLGGCRCYCCVCCQDHDCCCCGCHDSLVVVVVVAVCFVVGCLAVSAAAADSGWLGRAGLLSAELV